MKGIFNWYRNWYGKHKILAIISGLILLIIIVVAVGGGSKNPNNSNTADTSSNTPSSAQSSSSTKSATTTSTPKAASQTASRQVKGTAVTIGAGTFTGGQDVAAGLYDVTPGAGQSGNFIVTGTDTYDEILGADSSTGGVPKVRAQISSGDQIQISGLSSVTFTPVSTPFSTAYATTSLYAGTFTVGQDIGAGRYTVTPGQGQSGNFIVSGTDTYDEILGSDTSMDEVPSVTANLSKGDVITISGMSQVTLTPTN